MTRPIVVVIPASVQPEMTSDRQWWLRKHLPNFVRFTAAACEERGLWSLDYSKDWQVALPGEQAPTDHLEAVAEQWGPGPVEEIVTALAEYLPLGHACAWTVLECATRGRDA